MQSSVPRQTRFYKLEFTNKRVCNPTLSRAGIGVLLMLMVDDAKYIVLKNNLKLVSNKKNSYLLLKRTPHYTFSTLLNGT